MPDAPIAFFSYSREDSEFALRLASDLRAAGSSVWIDQLDIGPGQLWDRAVQHALENCPCMLLILSPASANSDNVMDEVNFALEQKKRIIPVLYRECDIPFRIRRFQHVDFRNDYDRTLQELKRCLHLGAPSEAVAAGPASASPTSEAARPSPTEPARFEAPPASYAAPVQHASAAQPVPPAAYGMPTPASSTFPKWAKIALGIVAVFVIGFIAIRTFNSNRQQGQLRTMEPRPVEPRPVEPRLSKKEMKSRSSGDFTANQDSQTSGESFALIRAAVARTQSPPPCRFPADEGRNFSVNDEAVWYVFAYRGGSANDRWAIDWVRPNGETLATHHVEHPLAGKGIYCYQMKIAGYSRMEGDWGVRLNHNGEQVDERAFRIGR